MLVVGYLYNIFALSIEAGQDMNYYSGYSHRGHFLNSTLIVFGLITFWAATICHATLIQNRDLIIGGEEAPIDRYNWFVKIGNRVGVLIAPEFFITKANYAGTIKSETSAAARIGFFCDEEDNCGQYYEDRAVENVYIHPDYDIGGPNLMLVQLNETSTINPSRIDHGRLASSYKSGQNNLFTAGFGTTDIETGAMSDKLLHLEQNFISNNECSQAVEGLNGFDNITSGVMCAQNSNVLKSPCYYDGGGPLYDATADKLVGIVSTGADDCQIYPTVYERIGPVFEWIQEIVCQEHNDPKPSFCTRQDTYFNIVSKIEGDHGQKWCLTRRSANQGAEVIAEVCSESEHQLWRIDRRGQMRSFHNRRLCMKNMIKQRKFSMGACSKKRDKMIHTFLFDSINSSLIWLSNKANFSRWGLRAVTLLNIPSADDEASKSVHVRKSNETILQKWNIEFPYM